MPLNITTNFVALCNMLINSVLGLRDQSAAPWGPLLRVSPPTCHPAARMENPSKAWLGKDPFSDSLSLLAQFNFLQL